MPSTQTGAAGDAVMLFVGLAPFLRMNIAGDDLRPVGQQLLQLAQQRPDDANLWLNLSLALFCLEQRETGLAVQAQALAMQRVYELRAAQQPARVRVLLLCVAGDLAANTPLDCLLEDADVDLVFYYLTPGNPLAEPIPEHDVLMVAISEDDAHHDALEALVPLLAAWPRPVVNAPQHIPAVGREAASRLLADVPGLLIPPTLRASRAQLLAVAEGTARLADSFPDCDFPLIVRPVGSHAGHDLEKVDDAAGLADYLARVAADALFIARFIDYRSDDGYFRKMRVALIDGVPYACHMGVSTHWMIHYLNAGMYEEAWKREDEARFMADFADVARRHGDALRAIAGRTQLGYVCVDCAQTADGRLLVFEIDHAMVVHAMDTEAMFPYKQVHMRKVRNALRDYLGRLAAKP